jgi:hypothetical protein
MPFMIVTIFVLPIFVDLMFMRCKNAYVLDGVVDVYVTLFLFASLDHTKV